MGKRLPMMYIRW